MTMHLDPPPDLLIELCAGGAATSLHAVAPGCVCPVPWMGGKRTTAPILGELLRLNPAALEAILLVDSGEWGWVWPVLLDPHQAPEVAAILREWQARVDAHTSTPEQLWREQVERPPDPSVTEGTAQWLWIQARALGGWPTWWDGAAWRQAGPRPGLSIPPRMRPLHNPRHGGTGLTLPGLLRRVEGVAETAARWLLLQQGAALGKPVTAEPGRWKTPGYAHVTPAARARGFRDRTRPGQIADRLPHPGRVGWHVYHGDAAEIRPTGDHRRTAVLLDPPYKGRTRYKDDLSRAATVSAAQEWDAAGATVAICEQESLQEHLPGWWAVNLTPILKPPQRGPEWVTVNRPIPGSVLARLPAERPQISMW